MYRLFLLGLSLCLLTVSGCTHSQTLKDSWKYTKKQYYEYLNTPAVLDMEATGSCEIYELALGDAVLEIDTHLQKLARTMENSDRNPDQYWVMNMVQTFPWLSGVALTDASGTPRARYPQDSLKTFDASPLLEPDPKQRIGALRAYVQSTPMGPEIYIANPVYSGEDLRGLVVAHFDPRALITMSRDPGSFMLASPYGVLWTGRHVGTNPVEQADWEKILADYSCGIIENGEERFFWTTRYFANLPIVYAIPTTAGNTQKSSGSSSEHPGDDSGPLDVSPSPVPVQEGTGATAEPLAE